MTLHCCALTELVTQIRISLYQPISGTDEYAYMRATVTGWGTTSSIFDYPVSYPDGLRQVSLPLVSNDTCNAAYYGNGSITDKMICAGYDLLTKGACYGDSGGPLMAQKLNG